MRTKQEIVAALKDTCVILDERKTQFVLMLHSLERENVATENDLEKSKEEEANDAEDDNTDEVDNGNENESSKEDSDRSAEAAV